MNSWISDNFVEIFGAATGIIYVFLEIRQTSWLWPLGIITSAVYVWIFFNGKLYADMSLQTYYVVISVFGWYWWMKGRGQGAGSRANSTGHRAQGTGQGAGGGEQGAGGKGQRAAKIVENYLGKDSPLEGGRGGVSTKSEEPKALSVTRLKLKTAVILAAVFIALYFTMWLTLSKLTDSPVPEWDAFLTSLSIIATWMLARKIYEHWYLWIIVNTLSVVLYYMRGLYPTVVLYFVYATMSFIGLREWKKTIISD
jgi:nicotinamide mononucleotide transporter